MMTNIKANILHRLQSGTVDSNVSREFCIFHGKNSAMQRLRKHIGKTLYVIVAKKVNCLISLANRNAFR
jgi:hypothetical protein